MQILSDRVPSGRTENTLEPNPMELIRVLIIDEHLAVRQALASWLGSYAQIEVVAAASTFQEGLAWAQKLRPDVILMELKGANQFQPDPVGEISAALADQPAGIIVLTSFADDEERQAVLEAGAQRYLLKNLDSARFLAEIEHVAEEVRG